MAIAAYLAFEPADEDAARLVAAELERNGWSPILAPAELRANDNLTPLVQTIGAASIVVLFASAATQDSKWLAREAAVTFSIDVACSTAIASKLAPTEWSVTYLTAETRQTLFPTSSATNKAPC